jgi:catechol 2,3-dioxygenase-like lactoylglutathione lyase family enzyme
MPLHRLDHVNVCTHRLAEMRAFYRDVLGMSEGARPAFSFGGAWLYLADRPCVHLVEVARPRDPQGELRLEHFAFAAVGLREFLERLTRAGVEYRISTLPDGSVTQVNVRDPDGNRIHVDFEEALAASC